MFAPDAMTGQPFCWAGVGPSKVRVNHSRVASEKTVSESTSQPTPRRIGYVAAPEALYFTDDEEACRLLAADPFALLVGVALDQQVTVQQAFAGPLRLKQRLGTLDPKAIAATDPAEVEAAFKEKPAIHRFPGSMATRVQDIARVVTDEYGGHAERLWTEAADADDLKRRAGALPGFGDMTVRTLGVDPREALRRRRRRRASRPTT